MKMTKYEKITKIVAEHFSVDYYELFSKSRERHLVNVRQWAIYFARNTLKLEYSHLGGFFKRDHATAIYAVQIVKNSLEFNKEARLNYAQLKYKLSEAGIYLESFQPKVRRKFCKKMVYERKDTGDSEPQA